MTKMRGWMAAALALLGAALAQPTAAKEICGNDVKAEIAKILSQFEDPMAPAALETQQELYKKFEYCLKEQQNPDAVKRLRSRACGRVPFVGSIYWEQMPCCGYDPQEQRFACPIDSASARASPSASLNSWADTVSTPSGASTSGRTEDAADCP